MADLTEYKPRQASETWLEFLKRQGPEVANGVAMALAGIRPGMMMRGPNAGVLNPRDYAIAPQMERAAPPNDWGSPVADGSMNPAYSAEARGYMRDMGLFPRGASPEQGPTRTPFQAPAIMEATPGSYEAAAALQALKARAANK